jgi:hypothetical protein
VEQQAANKLMMVRPASFAFNEQTASSNSFQKVGALSHQAVHELALKEFDEAVETLREHDIDVVIINDTLEPRKPDAIFPNNWLSIHNDAMVWYSMAAPNRRLERIALVKDVVKHVNANQLFDLTAYEQHEKFLEGTGSLVLDRVNNVAYACVSPRTNIDLVNEWCDNMHYQPVVFHAELHHQPVYHTNVMMAIGNNVAVCCVDAVADEVEKQKLNDALSKHHALVTITRDQMERFAGNILLVRNKLNKAFWVMSQHAMESLHDNQKTMLQHDGELLPLQLNVIETFGGGGARCMLAEVGG